MQNKKSASYPGVMVSSTFTDLVEHRKALMNAIERQDLKAIGMEHDSAKPGIDVIESSLEKVRKAAAYVGVISHKYGQIPEDRKRNPAGLSLTELEFNEAARLGHPVLLFIMGDNHPVKRTDVETDPEKIRKLNEFRETAKRLRPDSSVHRVYKVFDSLGEFSEAAIQAVADLRRSLEGVEEPDGEYQMIAHASATSSNVQPIATKSMPVVAIRYQADGDKDPTAVPLVENLGTSAVTNIQIEDIRINGARGPGTFAEIDALAPGEKRYVSFDAADEGLMFRSSLIQYLAKDLENRPRIDWNNPPPPRDMFAPLRMPLFVRYTDPATGRRYRSEHELEFTFWRHVRVLFRKVLES